MAGSGSPLHDLLGDLTTSPAPATRRKTGPAPLHDLLGDLVEPAPLPPMAGALQRQRAQIQARQETSDRQRNLGAGLALLSGPLGLPIASMLSQDPVTREWRSAGEAALATPSQAVAPFVHQALATADPEQQAQAVMGPFARAALQRQGRTVEEAAQIPQAEHGWLEGIRDQVLEAAIPPGLGAQYQMMKAWSPDPVTTRAELASQRSGMSPELMGPRSEALAMGAVPEAPRRVPANLQQQRAQELLQSEGGDAELGGFQRLVQGSRTMPATIFDEGRKAGMNPLQSFGLEAVLDPITIATEGAGTAIKGLRGWEAARAALKGLISPEEARLMARAAEGQLVDAVHPADAEKAFRRSELTRVPGEPTSGFLGMARAERELKQPARLATAQEVALERAGAGQPRELRTAQELSLEKVGQMQAADRQAAEEAARARLDQLAPTAAADEARGQQSLQELLGDLAEPAGPRPDLVVPEGRGPVRAPDAPGVGFNGLEPTPRAPRPTAEEALARRMEETRVNRLAEEEQARAAAQQRQAQEAAHLEAEQRTMAERQAELEARGRVEGQAPAPRLVLPGEAEQAGKSHPLHDLLGDLVDPAESERRLSALRGEPTGPAPKLEVVRQEPTTLKADAYRRPSMLRSEVANPRQAGEARARMEALSDLSDTEGFAKMSREERLAAVDERVRADAGDGSLSREGGSVHGSESPAPGGLRPPTSTVETRPSFPGSTVERPAIDEEAYNRRAFGESEDSPFYQDLRRVEKHMQQVEAERARVERRGQSQLSRDERTANMRQSDQLRAQADDLQREHDNLRSSAAAEARTHRATGDGSGFEYDYQPPKGPVTLESGRAPRQANVGSSGRNVGSSDRNVGSSRQAFRAGDQVELPAGGRGVVEEVYRHGGEPHLAVRMEDGSIMERRASSFQPVPRAQSVSAMPKTGTVLGGNRGESLGVDLARAKQLSPEQAASRNAAHTILQRNNVSVGEVVDTIATHNGKVGPSIMVRASEYEDPNDVLRAAAQLGADQGLERVGAWFEPVHELANARLDADFAARHVLKVKFEAGVPERVHDLLDMAGISSHNIYETDGHVVAEMYVRSTEDMDGQVRAFQRAARRLGTTADTESGLYKVIERQDYGTFSELPRVGGPPRNPQPRTSQPRRPAPGADYRDGSGLSGQSGSGSSGPASLEAGSPRGMGTPPPGGNRSITTTLPGPTPPATQPGLRQRIVESAKTFLGGGKPAEVKSKQQLARDMVGLLEEMSGTKGTYGGKYKGAVKNSPGRYLPNMNLIQLKKVGDLDTAYHEGGHALDEVIKLSSQPQVAAELDRLGSQGSSSWKPGMPIERRRQEGMAEFTRLWFEDADKMRREAPQASAALDKGLQHLGDVGARWKKLQVDHQARLMGDSHALVESQIARKSLWPYNLQKIPKEFIAGIFDRFMGLQKVRSVAEQGLGRKLNPLEDPWKLAIMNNDSIENTAGLFLNHSPIDFATKKPIPGAKSLESIYAANGQSTERFMAWRRYLVAKRAVELHGRGIEPGIPRQAAEDVVRAFEDSSFEHSAPFKQAAKDLYDFQGHVLQYAVDSGRMSAETAENIKRLNAARVPYQRRMESIIGVDEATKGGGSAGLKAGAGPGGWKAIKGSHREILDPLEQIIGEVATTVGEAEKNRFSQSLVDLHDADIKNFNFMEELKGDALTQYTKVHLNDVASTRRLRQALEQIGVDFDSMDISNKEIRDVLDMMVPEGTVPTGSVPLPEDHIVHFEDGKKRIFKILDPYVVRAVKGMDSQQIKWLRNLTGPAKWLRAGATKYSGGFIFRNLQRDTVGSATISRVGSMPILQSMEGLYHLFRTSKATKAVGRAAGIESIANPAEFEQMMHEFKAWGGMQGMDEGLASPAGYQAAYKRMAKNMSPEAQALTMLPSWMRKTIRLPGDALMTPFKAIEMMSEVSEQATRLGEMAAGKKAFAGKPGWNEQDKAFQAAFESKDLMNFGMSGDWGIVRAARQLVPFVGSSLSGFYREARSLGAARTWMRGAAMITLPSLALYMANRNNPHFWEKSQDERYMNWLVPIPKMLWDTLGITHPREAFWRWPKPHLLGALYASLPEQMAQYWAEKDPEAFKGMGRLLAENTLPAGASDMSIVMGHPLAKLVVELGMNKSWFRDSDIEYKTLREGKNQLPSYMRSDEYTSTASRLLMQSGLGKMTGMSPIQLDYAISSLGGTGAMDVVRAVDKPLAWASGEEPAKQSPRKMMGQIYTGNRFEAEDRFEARLDQLRQKVNSEQGERGDDGLLMQMESADKRLAEIRKKRRNASDPKQIQRLNDQLVKIAERFTPSTGRIKELRKGLQP